MLSYFGKSGVQKSQILDINILYLYLLIKNNI